MEKISLEAFSKETTAQLACFFLYTVPFVLSAKHESCEYHFEVFGKNSTQGLPLNHLLYVKLPTPYTVDLVCFCRN